MCLPLKPLLLMFVAVGCYSGGGGCRRGHPCSSCDGH